MAQNSQENLSRRNFLEISIAALAALSALVLGLPMIGYLIGPALKTAAGHFTKVVSVAALQKSTPTDLNFADQKVDGFIRETALRSVWAVKNTDTDITVFSPICPHLGCRYDWEAQSDHFVCPCHGSVFGKDGKVLAGPAPRPLDTLPTKIENGDLYVEWEQFKVGTSQKVTV